MVGRCGFIVMSEMMSDVQQKLAEDNLNLVHHVIWKYYPSFRYDEDLTSCANIGLCKAAMTWDSTKSKFTTYACSCIRNAIRLELRSRQHTIETISIDTPIEENLTIEDTIADDCGIPKVIDYSFINELSPSEKVVFNLRKQGYTVEEIETVTGYNRRKVLRCIRLAKAKYRKLN